MMYNCHNCSGEMSLDEYIHGGGICELCFEQMPMEIFVSKWKVNKEKE
jgi:transcription initiation factor IIE alpha subunit